MTKTWISTASRGPPSSQNRLNSNIAILTLLYFVQGIPYGFQSRFLPVYLRANGMSLTRLGLIKLLLLPWLLKVTWAPLVDRWGTKRLWLLHSVFGLAVTCLVGACIAPDVLSHLCSVIFTLNFLAATQDIAVDGIAISILEKDELGKGNTAQVVGYKIGSVVGGGFLVWLNEYIGWKGLFLTLSALYFVTLDVVRRIPDLDLHSGSQKNQTPLLVKETTTLVEGDDVSSDCGKTTCTHRTLRNGKVITNTDNYSGIMQTTGSYQEKLEDRDIGRTFLTVGANPTRPAAVKDWIHAIIRVPGTIWMAVYALTYKLGEQGAIGMFPLYLLDCGISTGQVGLWTGVIGQSLSILGSLLAGWMLSYHICRPVSMLCVLFLLRLGPLIIMDVVIWCGMLTEGTLFLYGVSVAAMCLLQFIGGLITTATFTMMMQCSQGAQQDMQATHWTMLATLEVLGKLTFMSVAGLATDLVGYSSSFTIFTSLSVLVLPLLRIRPSQTSILKNS